MSEPKQQRVLMTPVEAELYASRYVRTLMNRLNLARSQEREARQRVDECMAQIAAMPDAVRTALGFPAERGDQ